MRYRANYATIDVGTELAPPKRGLGLDWAARVEVETDVFEFEVPTGDAREAYVGIQAFDVGEYGHEVVLNGESLSGFDLPPSDGWQHWTDTVTGSTLHEGTNTLQIKRNTEGRDAFAVGTVRVHWKEPVDPDG